MSKHLPFFFLIGIELTSPRFRGDFGFLYLLAVAAKFVKPENVEDFEKSDGVYNKEGDKPRLTVVFYRFPKRDSFPNQAPHHKRDYCPRVLNKIIDHM